MSIASTSSTKDSSSETTGECFCCMEKFTKSRNKKVVCNHYITTKDSKGKILSRKPCEYEACTKCVRRYILSSGCSAQCMSCKQPFTREFMLDNLTKQWVDNEYKNYYTNLLTETEKSKLSEVMHFAEEYKTLPTLEKEIVKARQDMAKIHEKLNTLCFRRNCIRSFQFNKQDKKEKKKFIRRCVKSGCKGFLSTHWKCGLCSSHVCSKCLEIKEVDSKTGDLLEHTCDPEKIATVSMLNKDTKPCPCCGEMIMKISGCDQMWCPECKNAWSWSRGVVVHGYIHNPHYFEYQRRTKGRVDRAPGDVPCGQVPGEEYWHFFINRNRKFSKILTKIYRCYGHIGDITIRRIQQNIRELQDTRKLRILYILNEIEEEKFKRSIYTRKVKEEFNRDMLHVYELYQTVLREKIVEIFSYKLPHRDKPKINGAIHELKRCESYVTNQLKKISYKYKQKIYFTINFDWYNRKITSRKDFEGKLVN